MATLEELQRSETQVGNLPIGQILVLNYKSDLFKAVTRRTLLMEESLKKFHLQLATRQCCRPSKHVGKLGFDQIRLKLTTLPYS